MDPRSLGCRCDDCPLVGCGPPVFAEDNPGARIAAVGDVPHDPEVREGRPFVGPDGTMLTGMFHSAGVKRKDVFWTCLLYTSPSPRDRQKSRMPSSA